MIKLYRGDCLEIMKDIQDKSIDLILCDLPYGVTECKWDDIIPIETLWEQYTRIIKNDGAIVLFSAQPFTTKLINSNRKHYRYNWYWIKNIITGFAYAKYQPMRKVEDICVFYKKHGTYKPQGLKKRKNARVRQYKDYNNDYIYNMTSLAKEHISEYTGYPNNVLEFSKDVKRYHPTQKPVALLEYLIKTYTNEGDTVLDNCMGSGSTGVACVKTRRKFIGIEKENKYYDVANERIKAEALIYENIH